MPDPESTLDIQSMLQDEAIGDAQLAAALVQVHYIDLAWLAVSQLSSTTDTLADLPGGAQKIVVEALAQVVVHRDRTWQHNSLRSWLASLVLAGCRSILRRENLRQLPGKLFHRFSDRLPYQAREEAIAAAPAPLLAAWNRMVTREQQSTLLHLVLGLTPGEIAAALDTDIYPVDYWLKESRRKISSALSKNPVSGLSLSRDMEEGNDSLARALRRFWPEIPLLNHPFAKEGYAGGTSPLGFPARASFQQVIAQVGERAQAFHQRRRLGNTSRELLLTGLVAAILFFACRAGGLLPAEIIHRQKTPTPHPKLARPMVLPTPEAPFYYSYTVREGDTLESIARRAGVQVEDIRRLNKYNLIVNDQGFLYEGTTLILPGNPALDLTGVPTPMTPRPTPEPLSISSKPEDILQRIRGNINNWHTLWLSGQIIEHGPPGYLGPPLQKIDFQGWFSQPGKLLFVIGYSNEIFSEMLLAGLRIFPGGDTGLVGDFVQEGEQSLYDYLFGHDYLLSGVNFDVLREVDAPVGKVLVLEVDRTGGKVFTRLWVEPTRGTILRQLFFRNTDPEVLLREVAITAIAFDQDFPPGVFNPLDPAVTGFTQDASGLPLASLEDFPATGPGPYTGHERRELLPAPAGFDPSHQPLFLQWPESWVENPSIQPSSDASRQSLQASGTPTSSGAFPSHPDATNLMIPNPGIEVLAGRYSLGNLPVKDVNFNACRRSPDGNRVALSVSPAGEMDSRGTLYWFDLYEMENPERIGEIDQGLTIFAFSPDSRRLAYTSCAGIPNCRVYVMDLDTGDKVSYQSGEFYPFFLVWSPDGSSIVLVAMGNNTPPTYRMLVLDLNTGEFPYAAEYDAQTGEIPSNSPTIAWGLELPRLGEIDQGCMQP